MVLQMMMLMVLQALAAVWLLLRLLLPGGLEGHRCCLHALLCQLTDRRPAAYLH